MLASMFQIKGQRHHLLKLPKHVQLPPQTVVLLLKQQGVSCAILIHNCLQHCSSRTLVLAANLTYANDLTHHSCMHPLNAQLVLLCRIADMLFITKS